MKLFSTISSAVKRTDVKRTTKYNLVDILHLQNRPQEVKTEVFSSRDRPPINEALLPLADKKLTDEEWKQVTTKVIRFTRTMTPDEIAQTFQFFSSVQ